MTWRRLRATRRVVQAVFFAAFVALLFSAVQRKTVFPYADLFFRFDPLIALTAMLSAQVWIERLALALVTVGLTLVLGRVWCGWICPLGTLLEWVTFGKARRRAKSLPPRLALTRYVLLIAMVTAALLGNLTLLILDPLTLLMRATTTAVIPGVDWAILQVEQAAFDNGVGQGAVNLFEQAFRGHPLPVEPEGFTQAVPIFLLLLAVVLLGLIADRFWCRYLCPLGALLGLFSKVAVLRPIVEPSCAHCRACAGVCRVGAIALEPESGPAPEPVPAPAKDGAGEPVLPPERAGAVVVISACVMCLDCLVACGDKGMRFGVQPRPAPKQVFDPGRREFLTAFAGGAAGVMLLGAGVWNVRRDPLLIGPPGSQDEVAFIATCVRCSQCMKVCPTSGLQPAVAEAGLAGLWTPVLRSRLGYCDYGCASCGQICPSGAIPRLDLETKRLQVLGTAYVDRDRCLPWSYGTPCLVCQEMCPVPDKAVRLQKATVPSPQGGVVELEQPYVVADLCIGCGICEYRCPVEGDAAIRVTV